MALKCITDEPYKRDFYHWTLRGHCEGYDIPVDEGFEWYVEGGEINNIRIGYPKTPFWYELGNNPDYLSSRKIYYYRAWQTYYIDDELIKIYGEWKQFTSINPMCTGFTNFDAKRMMKKYYSYHGVIMPCNIQANPGTFKCDPIDVPYGEIQHIRVAGALNWGWYKAGSDYIKVHDYYMGMGTTSNLGQDYFGGSLPYRVYRFGVGWYTSGFPKYAKIVRAAVEMWLVYDYSDTDFSITIMNGMPDCPHIGLDQYDYAILNYHGNCGSLSTAGIVPGSIFIDLNDLTLINRVGITKFALISSKDISASPPIGKEFIRLGRSISGTWLNIWYKLPL